MVQEIQDHFKIRDTKGEDLEDVDISTSQIYHIPNIIWWL